MEDVSLAVFDLRLCVWLDLCGVWGSSLYFVFQRSGHDRADFSFRSLYTPHPWGYTPRVPLSPFVRDFHMNVGSAPRSGGVNPF